MDNDKMPEPVLRLGQQASPPFMMVSPGCNFTPDEVGRMLANRVVQPHYATWLVRKALECHGVQVSELQAEANEQARLNGMGAEREARLMAQVAELQAEVNDLARRLCLSAEHEIATNRHVYQMEIERDALAKDAARYRWMRKHCEDTADEYGTSGQLYFGTYAAGQLDAAIDAAMSEGER